MNVTRIYKKNWKDFSLGIKFSRCSCLKYDRKIIGIRIKLGLREYIFEKECQDCEIPF